jgi:hypothetical protein
MGLEPLSFRFAVQREFSESGLENQQKAEVRITRHRTQNLEVDAQELQEFQRG